MSKRRVRRHHRQRQNGQVILTFAIAFTFLLMGLIALVADLAVAYGVSATVQAAAQAAAADGATHVDINCFQPPAPPPLPPPPCPILRLIWPNAAAACKTSGDKVLTDGGLPAAPGTACIGSPTTCPPAQARGITATVSAKVPFPVQALGFPSVTITNSSSAFAEAGTDTPVNPPPGPCP